jgi:glutamine amidotransferase
MDRMNIVGIVNYGMGNLRSVWNAVSAVGGAPCIVNSPTDVRNVSHLILPGVGAFADAMKKLDESGWIDSLHIHAIERKKPFLGICLGMQLLAERGTEHGIAPGLGWIPGTVTRLSAIDDVRIPHIGWNGVELTGNSTLFSGIADKSDFYFVHSYAFRPLGNDCVTGWCHHGERFAASIQMNNIFGTQFHPEKSQTVGLKLLKNFIAC